jgi:sarcosine oxidase
VPASEKVTRWEASGSGVKVWTERDSYQVDQLVITVGPWLSKLVGEVAGLIRPERQVLAWFQPFHLELFLPNRFPVFNLEVEEERYYGLPVFEVPGLKVGKYHHLKQSIDPDDSSRDCHPEDERVLRHFVSRYFPNGSGPTMALRPCIFTNTADEHFILDSNCLRARHPSLFVRYNLVSRLMVAVWALC